MHADPIWMRTLLMIHIPAGFCSVLLAPVAMATAKGGKQHRRWGMVYLWSMGIVAATALPMALFRPILFLALVAVFSFYSAFGGYRVLKLKDLANSGEAAAAGWIAGDLTFATSLLLACLGAARATVLHGNYVWAVIFGMLGMRLAYVQLKSFVAKPKDKTFWLYTHLEYFIGSYIAAWSAFTVVTLTQHLGDRWYIWLWPSMIRGPAIVLTTACYRRKFALKTKPVPVS